MTNSRCFTLPTAGSGCSLFNADLALSVAMTTVSTIMSMGFLPLNLFVWITLVYGESVSVPWGQLFVPLAVVICAILGGLMLSNSRADRAASGARSLNPADVREEASEPFDWSKVLNKVGNLAGIGLICYSAYASGGGSSWGGQRLGFYIAVMTPCLLGEQAPLIFL